MIRRIVFALVCFHICLIGSLCRSPLHVSVDSPAVKKPSALIQDGGQKQDSVKKMITQRRIKPDVLPGWWYYPPEANQHFIYALGVSDPWLDTAIARKQAMLRGIGVLSLLAGSSVDAVQDIYSVVNNGSSFNYEQKFEEYTRIHNHISIDPYRVKTMNIYRSKYDETLVLLKYSLKEDVDTGKYTGVQATVFNMEMAMGQAREFHSMIDLWIKQKNDTTDKSLFYRYRNYENLGEIVSRYQEEEINIPRDYYYYKAGGPKGSDIVNNAIRFRYGLWNGFITRLLEKMVNISFEHASYLKDMSDQYAAVHNEELVRTIAKNRLSFIINRISITKEGIILDMDYQEMRD